MQSEHAAAPRLGPPSEPELGQRLQKLTAAMVNRPLVDALKYLDEHPEDLGSAINDIRGYLTGHGVRIPDDIAVEIRAGNSWTVCLVLNGVAVCIRVG